MPSSPMQQSSTNDERYPIDPRILVSALSVLQPTDATEIDLENGEPLDRPTFQVLIQRVHRRHQVTGLLERTPLGSGDKRLTLGPSSGLSATGAVTLAFQVIARIELIELTDALGQSPEQAGLALFQAREHLLGKRLNACDSYQGLLGRHADPGLERSEIAELIHHTGDCPRCNEVLHEFRALDDRISESRGSGEIPPPLSRPNQRSRLNRQALILWVPIIGMIALAVIALVGIGLGAGTNSSLTPLFAQRDDEHRGWLVMSSESEVMAIDLESGERRRILENPNHDWWNPWILSPDSRLAVRWEERTLNNDQIGALRAYDMNGDLQYLIRWQRPRSRIFSGWLDNRTVLFIERGAVQRIGVAADLPDSALPTILAVDLETGEEREIYRGPLDKAVASPDGEHIVLALPAPSGWPGKTVEIRPVGADGLGAAVNTVEDRFLSWPSRIVWSEDGQTVYLSLIAAEDLPDPLPDASSAPGMFSLEHIGVAALGINGSLQEFGTEGSKGWTVAQAVNATNTSLAVVHNPDGNPDGEWLYGTYDIEGDHFTMTSYGPPGGQWWNSEMVWLPFNGSRLVQQLTPMQIDGPGSNSEIESLVLMELIGDDQLDPSIVFHDARAIGERGGRGIALLQWVSNEHMRTDLADDSESPQPGSAREVTQADQSQQLFGDSEVAPTGRHIMLQESNPEEGTLLRLMHMQAWAGTGPRTQEWGEFSWLPRESAAIGTTGIVGRSEQANRLVVLATDRNSPLHGHYLDPAGIADDTDLHYRRPAVSPNGLITAFFVHNRRDETVSLWLGPWQERATSVEEWDSPEDTGIEPRLIAKWIRYDTLIFTMVTDWDDGYPQRISLMRSVVDDDGDVEIAELRTFNAGARDAGIDLLEIAVSRNDEYVAFRLRHYSDSDPESSATDSIQISPTSDLTQRIEVLRDDPGEGMMWTHNGDWLVAGIANRIALLDHTGRNLTYITDEPSAYPVLVGNDEVWYQEMSPPWRIMRFRLYS